MSSPVNQIAGLLKVGMVREVDLRSNAVTVERDGGLIATVRECWVLASDKQLSGPRGWTTEPTVHALVVETVRVPEHLRRDGRCKRFLNQLLTLPEFDAVIVEGVGSPVLFDALTRWGWECEPRVKDFFKRSNRG